MVWKKIKQACKSALLAGTATYASLFGANSLNAQEIGQKPGLERIIKEQRSLPKRQITLDIRDLRIDSEANTKALYSLSQLFGEASDYLQDKYNLDETLAGRFMQLATIGTANSILATASHELGHFREGNRYGKAHYQFGKNWTSLNGNLTIEQSLRFDSAGLNQNELNSAFVHYKTQEQISFDEGILFLIAKFNDTRYGLTDSHDLSSDLVGYRADLKERGIKLSKDRLFFQSLASDLLSAKSWDSIFAIWNYLTKGERTYKTYTFDFGNLKITPPLISHYLTPSGGFFDITSKLTMPDKNSLEFSLGTDANFMDNELDRIRLGGKFNTNLKNFIVSPFAYQDISRKELNSKGYSVGAELEVHLAKDLSITGKYEYNHNDVLQNDVKGKSNGSNLVLGISFSF